MNKKGVELTFNTIIIAIICLVVLVVIIAIFTNLISRGTEDLLTPSRCKSMGGGNGQCSPDKEPGLTCVHGFGGCKDYCCFSIK